MKLSMIAALLPALLTFACGARTGSDTDSTGQGVSCKVREHVYEFIIDESGSMSGEKWDGMREAVVQLLEELQAEANPRIRVGVQLFSNSPNKGLAPASMVNASAADELIALVNHGGPDTIGAFSNQSNHYPALDRGYRELSKFDAADRVLILISDGVPNDPKDTYGNMANVVQLENDVKQRVNDARLDGARTFVIGLGDLTSPYIRDPHARFSPTFFSELASLGGTAKLGCDVTSIDPASLCYLHVTPDAGTAAAVTAALMSIRAQVDNCP